MKTITQFLFGFGILFTSFSVICLGDSPVLAVVFLIATFVLAAIYLILIGINVIGISYIIVYVGAIAVLFLFIIMMINIKLTDILETGSQYTKTLPLAFLIVTLFIYIFFNIIPFFSNDYYTFLTFDLLTLSNIDFSLFANDFNLINSDIFLNNFLQIESIGFNLYTYGASLLVICSFILLLAMFAAIIISHRKS